MQRQAIVEVAGGSLGVRWDKTSGHVTLSGAAVPVYRGVLTDQPLLAP